MNKPFLVIKPLDQTQVQLHHPFTLLDHPIKNSLFFPREKARRVTIGKLFSSAVHKAGLQHEQTLAWKQTVIQRERERESGV
jgi:hypothetical protein